MAPRNAVMSRKGRRRLRSIRLALALAVLSVPGTGAAQTATLEAPPGPVLSSITPAFTARVSGVGAGRPIRYILQASPSPDLVVGLVLDTSFVSSDTVVPIQVVRPLPSEAQLYFKLRVVGVGVPTADALIVGPLRVPAWLVLVRPNSPTGDQLDTRRPEFVWRSARVSPLIGPWKYDVEITTNGRPVAGTSGITDTTFRLNADLEANASYRWSVRASLPRGEAIRIGSLSSFGVQDPALPSTTLFYQNFPNPFPAATAFATCFWFDLAEPGGPVALDVLDLRGNLVRNLVPGPDGQRDFPSGKYGRGLPGTGTNCDGRFVWDATGNDGRTVAPGVYIARFRVGNGPPIFRSILFRGR